MGTQSGSGDGGHARYPDERPTSNGELAHRLEDGLGDLRERIGVVAERASHLVRENPLAALAGAAALGFLVARLVSRR
jgi:ElaB/YqjD/DUF883 family membrane-anchored ribosome-binding protein